MLHCCKLQELLSSLRWTELCCCPFYHPLHCCSIDLAAHISECIGHNPLTAISPVKVDSNDSLRLWLQESQPSTDTELTELSILLCDGVSGGQAFGGSLSDVRMGGKCPSLISWCPQLFIQPGGKGRRRRGRYRWLQENQLFAFTGFTQQGVHPQVFTAQPATTVLAQAHRTQHSYGCKTTRTSLLQTI